MTAKVMVINSIIVNNKGKGITQLATNKAREGKLKVRTLVIAPLTGKLMFELQKYGSILRVSTCSFTCAPARLSFTPLPSQCKLDERVVVPGGLLRI